MTDPFGLLLAFTGADAGEIRFALSEGADALRWRVLRDGGAGLRGADPFLVRGADGRIRCLAAAGGGVTVWSSDDLEAWSPPHALPVGAAGVRGPKAYPDPARGDYQIVFTAGGRAQSVRTADFVTASAPERLLDRAGDGLALLHAGDAVYCFYPDGGFLVQERRGPGETDFTQVRRGIGADVAGGAAGPVVFAGLGGRTWYLLADDPAGTGLRPYVTRVLATGAWQPGSPDGMPEGARRGGVVTVTEDEFKRLEAHV